MLNLVLDTQPNLTLPQIAAKLCGGLNEITKKFLLQGVTITIFPLQTGPEARPKASRGRAANSSTELFKGDWGSGPNKQNGHIAVKRSAHFRMMGTIMHCLLLFYLLYEQRGRGSFLCLLFSYLH